jgi:D-alanyl-lipoteichoic acid acyltransferase DltB (MBOAT superfamily)
MPNDRGRKIILIGGLVLCLGNLFFFKYYGFAVNSLNNLLFLFGLRNPLPIMSIPLPVGISFFTFQALSYIVDVYRGEVSGDTGLTDVMLYIAFFPQLVAGPIVRASAFLPQLASSPPADKIPMADAFVRIFTGLFKKVFLASYLGLSLADPAFLSPLSYNSPSLLLALYGYALQIFCDFSAYSDIAIGIALLLGYRFDENFDQPYRSLSIREFWRRWHISLSTWLRDYLYIPLGGNRRRVYVNLFITMLLGGLWHGAAVTFILWGALHGLGLGVERFVNERKKKRAPETPSESAAPGSGLSKVFTAVRWLFVFHFVCILWIFFRAPNIRRAGDYLYGLIVRPLLSLFRGGQNLQGMNLTGGFTILIVIAALSLHFIPGSLRQGLSRVLVRLPLPLWFVLIALAFIGLKVLAPPGVPPFIYFQF